MSAALLFTYVWHYLVARLLYEQVLRPLLDGRPFTFLAVATVAVTVAVLLRRRPR